MAKIIKTEGGFHIQKDELDLKKDELKEISKNSKSVKNTSTKNTQEERLRRIELMLELLCAEHNINID